MLDSIPLSVRKFAVWLLAFVSPAIYFLLLLNVNRLPVASHHPGVFYVTLFFLVLVGALFVCESVSWSANTTLARKIVLMIFTFLGLLLQFAVIVVVLRAMLVAAIAYP
jgi:hypothetical protein